MFKPLKRGIKVFNNIGFDVETYGEENKFFMGTFSFKDTNKTFINRSEIKDYIINNKSKFKDSIVWCHNTSFDFLACFYDELKNFKIIQRGSDFISCSSYIDDNKFNIYTDKRKYKINFYDTMNFFKGSLAEIGKFINYLKFKSPSFIGEKPKTKEEWSLMKKYNIRDSEITRKFADFLQKNFNNIGCQLKPTIASTSMDLFKRKYLNQEFYMPKIEDIDIQKNAYYGGRTEIFNRGYNDEQINIYDFNSIYPYVMKINTFPNPNYMRRYLRIKYSQIRDYDGITNVNLYCPKTVFPILPVRNEKLIFSQGYISGYYTNYEIRKAKEFGYKIISIKDGYIYLKNIMLFDKFIDDLYNLRMKYKSNNSSMELIPKILMNSNYGKYGMRLDNKTEIKHSSLLNKKESLESKRMGLSDYYRIDKKFNDNNKPQYINPIWSLYTTAYARMLLSEKISDIIDNVFYIDTDSIFTTKILTNSKKLGDLKLEKTAKEYYIVKPKFYALKLNKDSENKTECLCKIKGLRKFGQYFESFEKLINDKKTSYIKFMKMRECLIRNYGFNSKIEIEKELSLEDNKRDWLGKKFNLKDFQYSRPLYVTE